MAVSATTRLPSFAVAIILLALSLMVYKEVKLDRYSPISSQNGMFLYDRLTGKICRVEEQLSFLPSSAQKGLPYKLDCHEIIPSAQ